jgi:catechol 2,3-dioxygenase-like lactoylglutathione lyase family enzyme
MNAVTERPRAKRRIADEFPERVRPSKFAHAVLTTPDLPRARAWYLNVFAARIAYENDKVCFLTYDDEHHRIGLFGMPKLVERPPNSCGLEHLRLLIRDPWGTVGAIPIPEIPGNHTVLDDQS